MRVAQLRLGLAARHQLADLVAHARAELEQPIVELRDLAAVELDHAEHLAAHQDRQRERAVQARGGGESPRA